MTYYLGQFWQFFKDLNFDPLRKEGLPTLLKSNNGNISKNFNAKVNMLRA
jgi:hypothetical protein